MNDIRTFSSDETNTDDHPIEQTSILDQMREEAKQPADVEWMRCQVPNRPNWELLVLPVIDYDLLNSLMKRASRKVKGQQKEWSPLTFAFQVISHTCKGVAYKGHTVQDKDGDDMLPASDEMYQMFDARSPQEVLRKMYGSDGHLIATGQEIVNRAGYGDIDVESGEGGPLDD